jgi:hypothetical protein
MVSGASRPFSTWNHSSSSETVASGILPRDDQLALARRLAAGRNLSVDLSSGAVG